MNGSLFVAQDGRLRRLTPVESERIMGFHGNYTLLGKCKDTQRYRATGNSRAVNVVRWIMGSLRDNDNLKHIELPDAATVSSKEYEPYPLKGFVPVGCGKFINATAMPRDIRTANLLDFVDMNADEKFYISPAGCAGILRGKNEHNSGMNARLEAVLGNCSKNHAKGTKTAEA